MAERANSAQRERPFVPPLPKTGMRLIDPAFPKEPWVIAQYNESGYIYIRRERDGRLWHHTLDSWAYAWERDYLRHA